MKYFIHFEFSYADSDQAAVHVFDSEAEMLKDYDSLKKDGYKVLRVIKGVELILELITTTSWIITGEME